MMAVLAAACTPITAPPATPVTATPAVATYAPLLEPAPCPLHVPDELEEGQTIVCGMVRLPQDRNDPAGASVALPYALIRAESARPAAEPLIFVAGGPGGSALAEFDAVYAWLRPLRRERDIVLYDQRGTLLAEPVLACPQLAPPDAATIAQAEAQLPAELRPLDADDLALIACGRDLQAQGIDLAVYDTATHAQDLLDLARGLGYGRVHLFGLSYGTRIALEAMRRSPQMLAAVVLDSALPPEVAAYETQSVAPLAAIYAALEECSRDAACAAAYPRLVDRFTAIPARLAQTPPALPAPWPAAFDDAAWWEFLPARMTPATLPYLPRLVAELEAGESATLVALLDGALPPPVPQVAPATQEVAPSPAVMAFVLRLNEAYFLSDAARDPTTQRAWRLLAARRAERSQVEQFITTGLAPYVAAEERAALLAELAALEDDELEVVCSELAGAPSHPITPVANLAVECRDEQPFNDYATAITAHRRYGIPDSVMLDAVTRLRHFWAQCTLWPAPPAPAHQSERVYSAVPTLIVQGAWDGVTPAAWAESTLAGLSHGLLLRFPGVGHGVLTQPLSTTSGCPAQIIRRFLADPNRPPDASCIARTYSVPWALPEPP